MKSEFEIQGDPTKSLELESQESLMVVVFGLNMLPGWHLDSGHFLFGAPHS